MTKEEKEQLKRMIPNGYHTRKDYPPFAINSWDDRNRFLDYVCRVIDDFEPIPATKIGG